MFEVGELVLVNIDCKHASVKLLYDGLAEVVEVQDKMYDTSTAKVQILNGGIYHGDIKFVAHIFMHKLYNG